MYEVFGYWRAKGRKREYGNMADPGHGPNRSYSRVEERETAQEAEWLALQWLEAEGAHTVTFFSLEKGRN